MSKPFKKAETLDEIAAVVTLEPLGIGDPRYVPMGKGRDSSDLARLRRCVSNANASDNRFAKIVFTGHRGCGKSTELLRLADDLKGRFRVEYFEVDPNLERESDIGDLLLWLVDRLVTAVAEGGRPLDPALVQDVVEWFGKRTLERFDVEKREIEAGVDAQAGAKVRFFGLSLGLLARMKSVFVGNVERRRTIRQELRNYSTELIDKVNALLDHAQLMLEQQGEHRELVFIIDNLDRLYPEPARLLFFDNGGLLRAIRAHLVLTVPIAMTLAPWNVAAVFPHHFTMPMVKTHLRNDRPFRDGLDALGALVAARIDTAKVFDAEKTVRYMARMSGGSVRDLMRLVDQAQLQAGVDGKDRIDLASAKGAVRHMRIEFERLITLMPHYLPLLAEIRRHKRDKRPDAVDGKAPLDHFRELVRMGAVLEYNGDQAWYDVHPIVQEIAAFKEVLNAGGANATDPPAGA